MFGGGNALISSQLKIFLRPKPTKLPFSGPALLFVGKTRTIPRHGCSNPSFLQAQILFLPFRPKQFRIQCLQKKS
jgi:hypothetical protein